MRRSLPVLLGLIVLMAAPGWSAEETDVGEEIPVRSGPIAVVEFAGAVNAASADHFLQALEQAEEMDAAILLVELDTPGGVITDMKDMLQGMLNSKVPVVVFVQPRGAWAGSAGVFITMAGHVAAMAPSTTIGAAHPVMGGGPQPKPAPDEDGEVKPGDYMLEKFENITASYIEAVAKERGRNVEWAEKAVRESIAATADEALELNVIDLIAEDRADLLAQLHGRRVVLGGETIELDIRDGRILEIETSLMTRVFQYVQHPQILALLWALGMLGIYFEYNNPGSIFPGALGATCLVLALIAMQAVPFSWTGIIFVAIGLGLMVAEAFFPAYGVLLLVGAALLLVGGSMVFDRPEVSDLNIDFWSVLVPLVAGLTACMAAIVVAMSRTRGLAQVAGVHELIGMRGVARTALEPSGTGTVFLRGEYWTAHSAEEIPAEAKVEALAVDGMRLEVKRADD